jgi:ketosteroid isomerase-like protein
MILALPHEVQMNEIYTAIRMYADAWRRGDYQAMVALYHDDFSLHYPGNHPLSGTHRGKQICLEILKEVHLRTDRQLIEIVAVMAGDARGAINVKEHWRRDGEQATVDRVFVYSLRGMQFDNCWLYDADQRVVAHFLRDLER